MGLIRLKSFVSLEFIAPRRAASCLDAPSACCCCNCNWNKPNGYPSVSKTTKIFALSRGERGGGHQTWRSAGCRYCFVHTQQQMHKMCPAHGGVWWSSHRLSVQSWAGKWAVKYLGLPPKGAFTKKLQYILQRQEATGDMIRTRE